MGKLRHRLSTWRIQGSNPTSLCITLVIRSLLSKISLCIVQAPPSQVLTVYFQTQKMGRGTRICLLWGSPVTECQSPCLSSMFPNQPLDVLTTLSPKLGTPESSINLRLASRHREPQEDWKRMKASEFSFDLWLRQCRPEQNSMGWSSVVLFLFCDGGLQQLQWDPNVCSFLKRHGCDAESKAPVISTEPQVALLLQQRIDSIPTEISLEL